MIPLHPQFVVDENGERTAVVVPIAEWNRILEDLDELDDIRVFDEAKAASQDSVPFDQAVREIEEGYNT